MSYYALWIDHNHAVVYKFDQDGVNEEKIKGESEPHGPHPFDKFYHSVAQKLGDAKEVMVMGPGVAKDEFKHHCEKHHHAHLAKAIVGVQAMTAHPTKAMMLEKAHEFFKSYHLWTKNY